VTFSGVSKQNIESFFNIFENSENPCDISEAKYSKDSNRGHNKKIPIGDNGQLESELTVGNFPVFSHFASAR
jgi:hypothetical protein